MTKDNVVVNYESETRLRHRRNREVVPVTTLGWREANKDPVDPDPCPDPEHISV